VQHRSCAVEPLGLPFAVGHSTEYLGRDLRASRVMPGEGFGDEFDDRASKRLSKAATPCGGGSLSTTILPPSKAPPGVRNAISVSAVATQTRHTQSPVAIAIRWLRDPGMTYTPSAPRSGIASGTRKRTWAEAVWWTEAAGHC
jgi:hypothetical protein